MNCTATEVAMPAGDPVRVEATFPAERVPGLRDPAPAMRALDG